MRHQKSGRKFSRTSAHRDAMFSNMAASIIKHGAIRTTLPKAKELRRVAEPLITLAKKDSVANRRLAFSRLRDKEAVGTLFVELGPRYSERPGGYLRILKCGWRSRRWAWCSWSVACTRLGRWGDVSMACSLCWHRWSESRWPATTCGCSTCRRTRCPPVAPAWTTCST